MTVRDLVKCSRGLIKTLYVEVRDNGKWVYGYRISENAQVYYSEKCEGFEERRGQFGSGAFRLKSGEVAEVYKWPPAECPTRVMCIKPEDAPEEVMELKVNYYIPRDTSMTKNDFKLDVVCYLPDLMIAPDKIKAWMRNNHSSADFLSKKLNLPEEADEDIMGQMTLDQFYEKEKIGGDIKKGKWKKVNINGREL